MAMWKVQQSLYSLVTGIWYAKASRFSLRGT
jgi:hypothetical protein